MAHFYIKEALLLLVAWVVFVQIRYWYRWRVFNKWGQQNGCEECRVVPNKLPWGIERFFILFGGNLSSRSPI
jgi:hypothetical protein